MPAGGILIHRVRWCSVWICGACGGRCLHLATGAGVLCLRLRHVLGLTGLRDRVLAHRTWRRTGGVLIYRATTSVLVTARLTSVLARVHLTVSTVETVLAAGGWILIRALADGARAATGAAGGGAARVLIVRRRSAVLICLISHVNGLLMRLLIREIRLR